MNFLNIVLIYLVCYLDGITTQNHTKDEKVLIDPGVEGEFKHPGIDREQNTSIIIKKNETLGIGRDYEEKYYFKYDILNYRYPLMRCNFYGQSWEYIQEKLHYRVWDIKSDRIMKMLFHYRKGLDYGDPSLLYERTFYESSLDGCMPQIFLEPHLMINSAKFVINHGTFDAYDYVFRATPDIKKNISDLLISYHQTFDMCSRDPCLEEETVARLEGRTGKKKWYWVCLCYNQKSYYLYKQGLLEFKDFYNTQADYIFKNPLSQGTTHIQPYYNTSKTLSRLWICQNNIYPSIRECLRNFFHEYISEDLQYVKLVSKDEDFPIHTTQHNKIINFLVNKTLSVNNSLNPLYTFDRVIRCIQAIQTHDDEYLCCNLKAKSFGIYCLPNQEFKLEMVCLVCQTKKVAVAALSLLSFTSVVIICLIFVLYRKRCSLLKRIVTKKNKIKTKNNNEEESVNMI